MPIGPKCQLCRRPRTATESIAQGVGPECAEKQQALMGSIGTSLEEVGLLAMHDDPTVRKWVEVARRALASRSQHHLRDAENFIQAARQAAAVAARELEHAA